MFLVGLTNPKSPYLEDALEPWTPNGAGERLYHMVRMVIEVSKEEYFSRVHAINVVDAGPRRVFTLVGSTPAVVLGRDAWSVLELPRDSEWHESHFNWHLVPHPSGRCRLYNDDAVRLKTGRLIARLGGFR